MMRSLRPLFPALMHIAYALEPLYLLGGLAHPIMGTVVGLARSFQTGIVSY